MPTNRSAKYDAASFILSEEIRNRTNTQTNSNRYIHTLSIGMRGYNNRRLHAVTVYTSKQTGHVDDTD